MRVAELTAYVVNVPLRREIKHASATRRESANLLVRARLADGTEGWGEGVPRSYVTGETPDTAIDQLAATPLSDQLTAECGSWQDVIGMCEAFQPTISTEDLRGCGSNALRCAVELSILDAFGKLFQEPVSAVTAVFEPATEVLTNLESVRYSTTITAETSERMIALKMRFYGFRQCKVKVGVEGADDVKRLGRIRRWIGRKMDLRLDVNEAWNANAAASKIEQLLRFNISCVEQPVPHDQVDSLAEIRRQVSVPIMLDESLTSLTDAEAAFRDQTCDLFNIRLSKCGGFLNSLRVAARAHEASIGYQLGCHPGETGILSAAGRHWATSVKNIRYLEGSYDRHLLARMPTNEDITFGYGGCAKALTAPGLGVTVNPEVFQQWVTQEQRFSLADG